MECNKDEALRARQIAEARMQKGEFVDALKFANKAKKLYPLVESITQILTICEVHNAAQKKLSTSHMDWYAILQIERLADEATVKKQYRKLALLLHPDKNKFAGAEAAFKLIGQANGVLSDQEKRSSYDKLGASVRGATATTSHHCSNGNVFTPKHDANAMKKNSNSHHNSNVNVFAAKYDANATNQKNSYPNSTGFNNQAGQMTFWTSCPQCNTKYQYSMLPFNPTVFCQQCLKSFEARVISSGYQGVSPSMQNEAQMHGPPKSASESTGGKSLGREYAGTFVQPNPMPMKRCAAGVSAHHEGEKNKDGCVPASKGMKSQTSKKVGSKKGRRSAPDSSESFEASSGDDPSRPNSNANGNGNVFASKHNANGQNYQKNTSVSHQYPTGDVLTAKHDAKATEYRKSSDLNMTGFNHQAGQKTFWTSCQHCNAKFQFCIPFVNATLRCTKCSKTFKARAIPPVNIQKEASVHGPSKSASESIGGKPLSGEHAGTFARSNPVSMKKCVSGVGASRGPQASQNVGSKRVRQSAQDSGKSFRARKC
ncbi:hypothetical protein VNO78_20378 [Psophocarpus tetragonolobus]|uniref:J domain-containing protein n=1 Tax=Psophocarpus tetragonolobus TaxID=3891 RepID=A0AAN9S992_PSOTE